MRSPSACDIRCPADAAGRPARSGLDSQCRTPTRSIRRSRVSSTAASRRSRLSAAPVRRRVICTRPLRGRRWSSPRPHLLGSAGTSPGSCRRPQTAPWQSLRSSCRHLAAPKHWRGETADVRPTRRESARSGLVAIRGPGSRDGSSMHLNRIHRRRQAIPTDFSGVVVYPFLLT